MTFGEYMGQSGLDQQALLRRRPSLANIPLPPQPEVLRKVLEEYRQSTPDLPRIAALISGDLSLSAAVLQAVNSPLFGLTHSVVSIQQAISLLGLRWVLMLVRAVAFRDAWGDTAEHARFWDTNNDVAALGLILARRLVTVDPEEVYAFCLFHDGGMLVMMRRFPDYKNLLARVNRSEADIQTDEENSRYGMDHAELGFLLGYTWNLPPHLCRAIMVHHLPFGDMLTNAALGPDVLTPLAFLKMAHHLSAVRRRLWRAEQSREWLREGPEVMRYLGLEPQDFLALQDAVLEELERDDPGG